MASAERKALQSLIDMRIEAAIRCLKGNPRYTEICAKQEETETKVEELYQRFRKEERIFIRRHYEGETIKGSLEFDEIYVQGLKDGIHLLKFLNVFNQEVSL